MLLDSGVSLLRTYFGRKKYGYRNLLRLRYFLDPCAKRSVSRMVGSRTGTENTIKPAYINGPKSAFGVPCVKVSLEQFGPWRSNPLIKLSVYLSENKWGTWEETTLDFTDGLFDCRLRLQITTSQQL